MGGLKPNYQRLCPLNGMFMQADDLVMFLKGNKTYLGSWNSERIGHQTNEDHENKGPIIP
jgi:hypothetical protein